MKLFKRERSAYDKIVDKFENSFRKTGFLADHAFKTPDRDLWNHMKELLTDCNTPYVFSNILVACKEVPYTEELFQRITLKEQDNKKLSSNKITGDKTFATTSPMDCKFYECIYIQSPLNSRKPVKKSVIKNTIKKIVELSSNYEIFPHVVTFLQNQLKYATENGEDDDIKDLFNVKNSPNIVLVPQLVDGLYYNVDGVRAYPFFTEKYHYYKTRLNQIQFNFKVWNQEGMSYTKKVGFFDVGTYSWVDKSTGEIFEKDIFYCRFFFKYYNPFMFFEPYEVEELTKDLYNEPLTDKTKEILKNTLDAYYNDFESGRAFYNAAIKDITIYKKDDRYFDDPEEPDDEELEDEDTENTSSKQPAKQKSAKEIKDEEEKEKQEDEKISTISRRILSTKMLKSFIMGYNGIKFYSFYPHLGDILLGIADDAFNNSKGRPRPDSPVRSNAVLQSLQLLITIKSNSDLFTTNTFTNPWDYPCLIAYKRTIQYDTPKDKKRNTKKTPPIKDRYLSFEEYGLLSANTVKSPETAGAVLNVNPFKCYSKFIKNK